MKRLMVALWLVMAGVNHCSENNDASSRQTLLDHPHFFRNALPACSLAYFLLSIKSSNYFEPKKVEWKRGASVGGALMTISAFLAIRIGSLVVAGHCIDLERARAKRIEGMLKK